MSTSEKFKKVKGVETDRFELTLLQGEDFKYYIRCLNREEIKYSEGIRDYETASFLFDLKLKELEGH